MFGRSGPFSTSSLLVEVSRVYRRDSVRVREQNAVWSVCQENIAVNVLFKDCCFQKYLDLSVCVCVCVCMYVCTYILYIIINPLPRVVVAISGGNGVSRHPRKLLKG
jgi:hypothetical protein